MGITVIVHHGLTRDALKVYAGDIAALFGYGETNPFLLDAVHNKSVLVTDPNLLAGLQQAFADGRITLDDIGIGDGFHLNGNHPELNEFQKEALAEIFRSNNGLSVAQQKLALYELQKFSMGLSPGDIQSQSITQAELMLQFGTEKLGAAYLDTTSNSVMSAYNDFVSGIDQNAMSDVGLKTNWEARSNFAVDLLQKAIDLGAIHESMVPIYQQRIAALNSGVLPLDWKGGGVASSWVSSAMHDIVRSVGIDTKTYAYTNIVVSPKQPSQFQIDSALKQLDGLAERFQEADDYRQTISDTASKLSPVDGPLNGAIDVGKMISSLEPLAGRVDQLSGLNAIDGDGKGLLTEVRSMTELLGGRANSALAALDMSSSLTFRDGAARIFGALNDATHELGKLIDKMPSLAILGAIGVVFDFAVISEALEKAVDQYEAGDQTAAYNTVASAVAEVILTNMAGFIAAAGALALGAPGAVALLAALAAGMLVDTLWNDYAKQHPEWFTDQPWAKSLIEFFDAPNVDPIVIDLDGDGIELTALGATGALFDLDGDGFAELTGWVSPDDGILVRDLNGNGKIDDIDELFGSADMANGFAELAKLDSNGDGMISATDAQFGTLRIWQDFNQNGVTDAGELKTLSELGVASISLTTVAAFDHLPTNPGAFQHLAGNTLIEVVEVGFTDGRVSHAGEILFRLSQVASEQILPEDFSYDPDVFGLPALQGRGDLPDLWVKMTTDPWMKPEVTNLIEQTRSDGFGSLTSGFEELLVDWADVGNVVWLADIEHKAVIYVYDRTEYDAYEAARLAPAYLQTEVPPMPKKIGHVILDLTPRLDDAAEVSAEFMTEWLDERNLVAPGFFDPSLLEPPPVFTTGGGGDPDDPEMEVVAGPPGAGFLLPRPPSVTLGSGPPPPPYHIMTNRGPLHVEEPEPAPVEMSAAHFAFLQKYMGQNFTVGRNFVTSPNLIASEPSQEELEQLIEGFENVRDYLLPRFLVQSAWSIWMEEGEEADFGALAPFLNLFVNPFKDSIEGDSKAFVSELIAQFRTDQLGDDDAALDMLALFQDEMAEIPALVVELFPDIPLQLVSEAFDLDGIAIGTSGDDNMVAVTERLVLGGSGDDQISVTNSGHVIMGGEGNDTITGGEGADYYVYSRGDGSDIITDFDLFSDGGKDEWVFTDISASEVSFSQNADNDLVMTLATGETITIVDQFQWWQYHRIEQITFSDGVVLDAQGIRDKSVSDMKSSGTVLGSEQVENYRHSMGDGSYVIIDRDEYLDGGKDTFTFRNVSAGQVRFSQNAGNDLIMTLANGETVTIIDQFQWWQQWTIEQITFADGTVLDLQGIRDKSVADQKLTGNVTGSQQVENYSHALGDGSYVITDRDDWGDGGTDTFTFTNQTAAQVKFSQNAGQDLVMTLANGDTVTVVDQFNNLQWNTIETISFADGVVFDAQGVRNKMVADQKVTGSVVASEQAENYTHELGDGSYTITDYDIYNDGGADSFAFTDQNASQVTFSQNAGQDLVMTLSNGEVVTIIDQFHNYQYNRIETISFADGTFLNASGIRNKMLADMGQSGAILGSEQGESYVHTTGDGSYTITDFDLYNDGGADSLSFVDLTASQVKFGQNAGQDLVMTLSNGEVVTIIEQFHNHQYNKIETISFADGTVLNAQGIRNKSVADMKFTGTVSGSQQAENYEHALGDGNYTITDYDIYNDGGADSFAFTDQNASQVKFSQNAGQDLVMTLSNGETLTVVDQFHNHQYNKIETISFADGTVLNAQGIRNKMVADMKASGAVLGSEQSENYAHTLGDGTYTITDYDIYNDGGNDTFAFTNQSAAQVKFSQNAGQDLVMTLSNGETVTMVDQFHNHQYNKIETISFADGTVLNAQGIRNKSVADMKATGIVTGSEQVENYSHALGDGSYVITDRDDWGDGGNDTLAFTNQTASQVAFSQNAGQDLVMTLSNGEVVTIIDQFANLQWNKIETISLADGTVLNAQGIRNKSVADMKATGIVTGSEQVENYTHALGDGSYVITDRDYWRDGGNDTFTFTNVEKSAIEFSRVAGDDLNMGLSNGEDITIVDFFVGTHEFEIEFFNFSGGTTLTAAQILAAPESNGLLMV